MRNRYYDKIEKSCLFDNAKSLWNQIPNLLSWSLGPLHPFLGIALDFWMVIRKHEMRPQSWNKFTLEMKIGSLRIRTWRLQKMKNIPSHFKGRIWRSLPRKLHASQGLIQNFFQLCMGGNLRTEHWPMHDDDVHPTSLACISQQQGIYQYFGHQVLVFFQFLKCFPHLFCKIKALCDSDTWVLLV